MESNKNLGRAAIGIVLILIGAAFVAKTLNIFPYQIEKYLFTWEMILIVLGVIFISTRENKTTGWILLIIGIIFWIPDVLHFRVPYSFRRLFWPMALIAVGLVIIFRSGAARRVTGQANSVDYMDDVSIFGGGDKVITTENFQGGKVTAIFGGSKIDLTGAKLAPGQNVIDIFCVFGGCTFIVPENWNVKVDAVSILGGFSDKRRIKNDVTKDVGKELIIKGFCMFGGGELKSY